MEPGPDATPVVLPLREFAKEHHRKLSSLPQIPQLASAPSSRLVMSFWDREISIWRVPHGPPSISENPDGRRHRLVGKVMIQVRGQSCRYGVDGRITDAFPLEPGRGEHNFFCALRRREILGCGYSIQRQDLLCSTTKR